MDDLEAQSTQMIADRRRETLPAVRPANAPAGQRAHAWPVDPVTEYGLDAAQRAILLLDVLCPRGNNALESSARVTPHVLAFEFELIADGRDLERPVNYGLVRIIPPAGTVPDDTKRPFVIFDPRAGHGPGIAAMKQDSEIGEVLAAGHPCNFVGFVPHPIPGQTIEDVCLAEVNQGLYATFVRPALRAMATPQTAEALRLLHPNRLQFSLFSDRNPFMAAVGLAAVLVRQDRRSAEDRNPLLAAEHLSSDSIQFWLKSMGQARDMLTEHLFHSTYGSLALQAALGLAADNAETPRHAERDLAREAAASATRADVQAAIDGGGVVEAFVRAVMYVVRPVGQVDERGLAALKEVGALLPADRQASGRIGGVLLRRTRSCCLRGPQTWGAGPINPSRASLHQRPSEAGYPLPRNRFGGNRRARTGFVRQGDSVLRPRGIGVSNRLNSKEDSNAPEFRLREHEAPAQRQSGRNATSMPSAPDTYTLRTAASPTTSRCGPPAARRRQCPPRT